MEDKAHRLTDEKLEEMEKRLSDHQNIQIGRMANTLYNYRTGDVRPICAQVLQGSRNQEQGEALLLQEAGRAGQDLPQFAAFGDERGWASAVYRQRYDGILCQRRLL